MFPFDLRGPEFLIFFTVLGICVLVALHRATRRAEGGAPVPMRLSDPYLIAALTGGKDHLLRVATLSLIDRRLLSVSGETLQAISTRAEMSVRNEVEKQLLRHFRDGKKAKTVFGDSELRAGAAAYEEELTRRGLLPDPGVEHGRTIRFLFAMLVIESVGIIKIAVAVSRGRTNLLFLLILMVLFGVIGAAITFRKRTRWGDETLADLRSLFSGLKDRCSGFLAEQSTSEMALLAGVYGVGALPESIYPYRKTLYPKADKSSGSAGCGSSCGSSCGGGGCGGGCGGCGS